MAKKPSTSSKYELSLDSLVDVFMNVLGMLMLTAISVAISLPPRSNPSESSRDVNPKVDKRPSPQADVYLAEERTVETQPFYIYLRSDGARPVDPAGAISSSGYFDISTDVATDVLRPTEGAVLTLGEYSRVVSQLSPEERHVVFLIDSSGVGYYRRLREIVSARGIQSGWTVWDKGDIRLTSEGGTSINSVQ